MKRRGVWRHQLLLALLAGCLAAAAARGPARAQAVGGTATIFLANRTTPPVEFAAQEIAAALRTKGYAAEAHSVEDSSFELGQILVSIIVDPACGLAAQGYQLEVGEMARRFTVTAVDAAGAMYGGLHLAEAIRCERSFDDIAPAGEAPYLERRGLKFNIPLDARTPSYDDTGDAAQENYAEMWDFAFWQEFLDNMARHRYNVLTLWNPHPFPSLVKVKEYPEAALADVCVTTLKPVAQPGRWNEPQLVTQEIFDHLRVVKKMTIEEKIDFWRRVMRYARGRGIEVYFITWNVCLNSVAPPGGLRRGSGPQAAAAGGKYGVTESMTNPESVKYLRASVRDFILTYPDLAGIGVTAGEHMPKEEGAAAKEKWLWESYGLGVLEAQKEQPGRTVKFIHRHWWTEVGDIMREWQDYPGPFELEFKYARARLYSSPKPPFARQLLSEMKPYGLKCWWNLRNDDIFCHRWGDPNYVREFVLNFPREQTAGYFMGSDGYVWGREFASLEGESPRQLEIVKHWYSFLLWGRLGYNPRLDRAFFEKVLTARFPEAESSVLYEAWAASSRIIPQVNRFHWRDWDHMWSVEGCLYTGGFRTVEDFINTETMEGSGLLTIPEYVAATVAQTVPSGVTPLEVADNLDGWAAAAAAGAERIRGRGAPSKELRGTLTDIESMAYLGRYYAAKIRGGCELALYRATNEPARRQRAVEHLTRGVDYWTAYAAKAGGQYRPQLLARTNWLDWNKLLDEVKRDVEIARRAQPRVLKLSEITIRDPFILADAGSQTYYLYAQMSFPGADGRLRPGVGAYASKDLKSWTGPDAVFTVPDGFWADEKVWAPEVHAYGGKYYLFVTLTGKDQLGPGPTGRALERRGSQVLAADSPLGAFAPFRNGPHTPPDWMALHATLYVEEGQPWLIFCHEWIQITDGTVEMVRLTDDLSEAVGAPATLFRATDAPWVRSLKDIGHGYHGYVTDGPFLYRTKAGKLLMLWSGFSGQQYAQALAVSESGRLAGPWRLEPEPLFTDNGGHGMVFRAFDGRLLLVLHQPSNGGPARARLFEVEDNGQTLRLKTALETP